MNGDESSSWPDVRRATQLAGGLLLVALLLRGSLLGWLLAAAAAVPSLYAMWVGAQEEGQRGYATGVALLLASAGLTLVLFLLWLF